MHCLAGLQPHPLTETLEDSSKATVDGSKSLLPYLGPCRPGFCDLGSRTFEMSRQDTSVLHTIISLRTEFWIRKAEME